MIIRLDDSKFGQKMLEKMGWKKGEGIGRRGQGMKENIKIRWKLDNKGWLFSILCGKTRLVSTRGIYSKSLFRFFRTRLRH